MGYRAYVVKAGSVDEYTRCEYFNRMEYEVHELFDDYNIRFESDFHRRKLKWTIKAVELNTLIALLEESPNEVCDCFPEDRPYTNQELADIFKEWVEQADKEDGFVHIHWN